MILPNYTRSTPGSTLAFDQELFLVVKALGLYSAFLAIQSGRHRSDFSDEVSTAIGTATSTHVTRTEQSQSRPLLAGVALLVAYLVPVIYMAALLAHPIDYLIETLHAPKALGGVIIAVLIATPEAIGAIRAAVDNNLQRSVNIFLGSVLSTIALTISAMLLIGHFAGRNFDLGLQHTDFVMLLLTVFSSVVTFASVRTNVLQGAVHILLFLAYLLLIFQD